MEENNRSSESSKITSEQTFREIWNLAKKDRQRALDAYDDMRQKMDSLPESKINSMYFQALNQAQQLVQTSTDKLIELAKVLQKRETTKDLKNNNLDLADSLLLEDDREDFKTTLKKLNIYKNKN